jgi:hypothetical protein
MEPSAAVERHRCCANIQLGPDRVVEAPLAACPPQPKAKVGLMLAAADQYEQLAAYIRVTVMLASGKQAWVYVDARSAPGAS